MSGGKALPRVMFKMFNDLRREFDDDNDLRTLRDDPVAGTRGPKWRVIDDLPIVEDKIFLPPASPCLSTTIELAHNMGHKGIEKTLHRFHTIVKCHPSPPPLPFGASGSSRPCPMGAPCHHEPLGVVVFHNPTLESRHRPRRAATVCALPHAKAHWG
jgi:hypothetical protein